MCDLLLDQGIKRRMLDRGQTSPGHATSWMKHLTICGEQSKPLLSAMAHTVPTSTRAHQAICTYTHTHKQQMTPPWTQGVSEFPTTARYPTSP
ncbi:hypothetical protein V8C35DRAFT_292379 [Trichoderma chlorosporum]